MSIENYCLSSILEERDFQTVSDRQITPKFFSGKNKRAFRWVTDFFAEYKKVPSVEEFKKKFPQIDLPEPVEPLAYYCDEVRMKTKHNIIVEMLEEAFEHANEFETEEAYKSIIKTIRKIESEVVKREYSIIGQDTEKRWEKYLERRNSGGITGIETTLAPFDAITGGLGQTDLVGILGYTNIGKTWLLIILTVLLAKVGVKVLFITREMSVEQVERRIDAVWANISYSDFSRGRLSPTEEAKFQEYLAEMKQTQADNLIIELATGGVSNVAALCDKHEPEVLAIDGGYLMTDDSEDKEWRGLIETIRGFKHICLSRKIPCLMTLQLTQNKASLSNISFAKAIAQDFDNLFGLEQSEEQKADKELKVVPLKLRDSDRWNSFLMNWDFHKMNYEVIYMDGGTQKKQLKVLGGSKNENERDDGSTS